MKDDYFARAQLVMVRIERVQLEAEQASLHGDADRVRELQDEATFLLDSMLEIREEQLLDHLSELARPSWWRRLTKRG